MGLDMYIFKSKLDTPAEQKCERVEAGYWRKANQIFRWLEDNVCNGETENCAYYTMTKEDFQNLRDVCQRVLADHSLAPDLLPVREGFFFGSYEYDEHYFKDLEDTVEICDRILMENDFDTHLYEYWAWW